MSDNVSKWTCGECGDVFESSGAMSEFRVMRWRADHKEEHRIEALSPEERETLYRTRALAWARSKGTPTDAA